MRTRVSRPATWILTTGLASIAFAQPPARYAEARYRAARHAQEAPDCSGEPCAAVERGFRAFHDSAPHGLTGNGRSCATCHVPEDRFQLSPTNAEARFQLLDLRRQFDPDADDPLFRPIDADDFLLNGEQASDFGKLRRFALVRVVMPLPSNVKLIDPATNQPSQETSVDVWRMVPPLGEIALTGPDGRNPMTPRSPNLAGGYQLDGRMATLQDQARGALRGHGEIKGEIPTSLLDDLASFERTIFSSPLTRALAEAVRAGLTPLPSADPALTEFEERGKKVFDRACAQCHGGAGLSTPQPPVAVRYHDVLSACPRPVDTQTPPRFEFAQCPPELEALTRTYEFTLANGDKIRRSSSDPGRALLTGFVGGPPPQDDWQKFDNPSLRALRFTAPYFHNNSAATLEEVVEHYIEFFKYLQAQQAPGVFPPVGSTDGATFDRIPKPEERAALLAYLRRL